MTNEKENLQKKKVYVKPEIKDDRIEIEDPIAASGDDIYNVREIFK